MMRQLFLFLVILSMSGCSGSQQFAAIPAGVDRQSVAHQSLDVSAKRYKFTPEVIRVKEGTLVTLRVTATDGTHGFQLSAFGIDERLDEGTTKEIEFFASKKGEYPFKCSHLCGLGHLGMNGKIVVE